MANAEAPPPLSKDGLLHTTSRDCRASLHHPLLPAQRSLLPSAPGETSEPPPAAVVTTQLDALSWTLAVATSSTQSAALQHPCITLDLRLRAAPLALPADAAASAAGAASAEPPPDAAAAVWHERVELTMGQLAVVEASLREALQALERA